MPDTLNELLDLPEAKPQKVATGLLDKNLQFLADYATLGRWAGCQESIQGLPVTAVFPELSGSEAKLRALFQRQQQPFIREKFSRSGQDGRGAFYVLQIEQHPRQAGVLQVSLIDVTRETYLEQNLRRLLQESPPAGSTGRTDILTLRRQNRTLRLLNEAGQILTATLDMDQVLERLLRVATQVLEAAGCSVWLWQDGSTELVCRAAFHPGSSPQLLGQKVQAGHGVAGWVAQTGQSAIVVNPQEDDRFYPHIDAQSGFRTASLLAVPLTLRGQVLGVLEAVNKLDDEFTPEDLSIAETLAVFAAIALDNADLVETLQQKMDDLQRQNEELDAFDHTVAHDLQNPLSLVVGFADVILQQEEEISEDEQQRALEVIVSNAHRMGNIIQELLILSSVRKSEVETHPLLMDPIVAAALERLQHVRPDSLELILPESWPTALGYGPWIEEVWENYLSNAFKYGGEPARVELGSSILADGRIRFWVRDNGPGIPPEKQKMLFTPFTKLSEIRVTGHGLGLSIVRRIVEKLGGEVDVKSEVGAGSEFGFILPAYRRPDVNDESSE